MHLIHRLVLQVDKEIYLLIRSQELFARKYIKFMTKNLISKLRGLQLLQEMVQEQTHVKLVVHTTIIKLQINKVFLWPVWPILVIRPNKFMKELSVDIIHKMAILWVRFPI